VAEGYESGDQVVIVRGLLAGIGATVLRQARMGFYLIELDPDAPRWAAIRRARAAEWALVPMGRASAETASPAVLARRRRIARLDLLVALVLVPVLLAVWSVVPALAAIIAVGVVFGMAALHATDRAARRPGVR
jgi:hypothetical protein